MDCHKDVGRDVQERGGYHGRIPPQSCRSCHTDHKGRQARIVELDQRRFDHAQTDYPLRGKHLRADCTKCHAPAKRYREAPLECNVCHARDDVHKALLGPRCADCHTEADWRQARFDHDKTRLPLAGKHASVKCAACHKDQRYTDTPRDCHACHRKDDEGAKAHKGRFGAKCESCHDAKGWRPSTFNHDTDTNYPLQGKHRLPRCVDCHTGMLFRDKLPTACVECHRKDDKHRGSLGNDCAACHTERQWTETGRFDHDRSAFALLGKHKTTACRDCHRSANYKEAPSDCYACHRKDDRHEATLGTKCADCHLESDWKTASRFDHDRTKFALRNAHAARHVQCKDCHADLRRYRNTPLACVACHKKTDKHEGQQGDRCESCHGDRDWKTTQFDHRLARFALVGRHAVVKCGDCHASKRYKEAPRDCHACHRKDDRHERKYGAECERCHNARSWALWEFDHGQHSRFALDGAHGRLACTACHAQPAPAGRKIAEIGTGCVSCHRRDDKHDGAFGALCEQCHSADRWKRIRQRLGAGDGWRDTPAAGTAALARARQLDLLARRSGTQ